MPVRKIALVFLILVGAGIGLFALVWRMKGWLSMTLGIIGALLIIGALKFLENALDHWYREKRRLKKLEEDLYGASGAGQHWNMSDQSWEIDPKETAGPDYVPELNLPLRRKLLWWFGIFAALGFAAIFAGRKLPLPFGTLATGAGLAFGLWNALMFYAAKESSNSGEPTQDFAFRWGSDPLFRRNNILLGLLLLLVFVTGMLITPAPPHAAPYIIGTFSLLVAILFGHVFYVQWALKKGVPQHHDNWSVGQRRMEQVVNVVIVLFWIAGYPVVSHFLPDYIRELYFALLFSGAGLLIGYFVHDHLKNRFPGFFTDEERQMEMLVRVYVSCLILTLCTAAVVNYKTAGNFTRVEYYPVIEKSENYMKKNYLWLEIAGQKKRFEPGKTEWENIRPGDTLDVLVGKGVLGFDVILKYGGAVKK